MALHEQSVGASDEWYTPPYVFEAFDCTFDLDVASPGANATPWIPARSFITRDSLDAPWIGVVWMNPPFGPRNGIVPWLDKFFTHGNGIALVPDRTSAPWWQTFVPRAELILFVTPKIKFIAADGTPGPQPAQGTSLLAIGQQGCAALKARASAGPAHAAVSSGEIAIAQRASGYSRIPDENYVTIEWPIVAVLLHLPEIRRAWDPCARGSAAMTATLRAHGIEAFGTGEDFFSIHKLARGIDCIVCNPPYGASRRGELAERFIEHSLDIKVPRVAMLLRADFDRAIGRQHLFRHHSAFAFKLILLGRINWFEGPSNPSDNHSWFVWDWRHLGAPTIRYVTRAETER
jgi:DNA N-6-adenine-methyltransferase (Dam)